MAIRRRAGHPGLAAITLLLAAQVFPAAPAAAGSAGAGPGRPGDPTRIDFLHLEAFREPTWMAVDLPASHVTLLSIRVLTANRSWTLGVCGAPQNPQTCSLVVGSPTIPAVGWRGDFINRTLNLDYRNLELQPKLHLLVTPTGGDWMIFRIRLEVRP